MAGVTPSSGESVVSLVAGGAGTFAVLATWVPSTQTCWAILDATAPTSIDGRTSFTGTLYIRTSGAQQSICKAATYDANQFPSGSVSSVQGFAVLG